MPFFRVIVAYVCLSGVLFSGAYAQDHAWEEAAGYHRDTLDVTSPTPYFLRPFIIPQSEQVWRNGLVQDTTAFALDYRYGRLTLAEAVEEADTVVVRYQVFPFAFQDVYRLRALVRDTLTQPTNDSAEVQIVAEEVTANQRSFDPFGNTKLERRGSISRGILAGNNRDATIESGLRLSLAGEIVEGVNVRAVLTDQNTPILPEGTTQSLSDFDRVFIEIAAPSGTAQLGDFDLNLSRNQFAQFNRKLQGIKVSSGFAGAEQAFGGDAVVAGATTRGIFRSQIIEPQESVQGPYRLEGLSGERFILVIPGTEVVYLDGQRLTRGETADYVIDYATAEVTFTAKQLMASDRRLVVEFQYTTNQFTRTLLATQVETQFAPRADGSSRGVLGVTFLRESDSDQFNEEFGFTSQDSLEVVNAGDADALRSGATEVDYDPEAVFVQYRQEIRDFNGDTRPDTFFVALNARPDEGERVFRVRFTRVGTGQGAYQREGQTVNGILYRYVGAGNGTYIDQRLLPKPKQQRLFDVHGRYEVMRGIEVFGEWAQSLNDANRLSRLDAEDDIDEAYIGGARLKHVNLGGLGHLDASVQRRQRGAFFTTFNRTRSVEFARDWNLSVNALDVTRGLGVGDEEVIDEAALSWAITPQTKIDGMLGQLDLGTLFDAQRRTLSLQSREVAWPHLTFQGDYITSTDLQSTIDGQWTRQRGRLQHTVLRNRLVPSFEIEQEERLQRTLGTDSLSAASFSFVEYRPGLTWHSSGTGTEAKLSIGSTLEVRTEKEADQGQLRHAADALTAQTTIAMRPNRIFKTDADIGYRVKRFSDFFRVNERRENSESVVIRWNGDYKPLQRAIDARWFYEALTERTPTLQEIYVRTGPELGEFVWEDFNEDGAIQVDEFVPERTPNEGNYYRTFVPSDSLTSIISVQARLNIGLDPSRLWRNHPVRWKRWLAQVQTRTTLDVLEKSREPDLKQIYLLNLSRFRDPLNTLNGRLRVVQRISLFRRQPAYGLDATISRVRGLRELATGEEERFNALTSVEGFYRIQRAWTTKLTLREERNRVFSEAFASRRYNIQSMAIEPTLTYTPFQGGLISLGVGYAQKEDQAQAREATVWTVPLDLQYRRARRLQVSGRLEIAEVAIDGDAGVGLAQFELTDGRGPGTSYLWLISGRYQLNSFLTASFSYDGRLPSTGQAFHTVRMQMSAQF